MRWRRPAVVAGRGFDGAEGREGVAGPNRQAALDGYLNRSSCEEVYADSRLALAAPTTCRVNF